MRISLAAARTNQKLTQQQSADALGVSRNTIRSWENYETSPSMDMVEAICELYKVDYHNIHWRKPA